jgi:glutathione S-transferase
MIVLTAMPYSPWSEKARWALDHHRVPYQYEAYTPVLGELKLRLRLRKPRGRITVPVLNDHGTWCTDSFAIAQRAEQIGHGAPLFPAGKQSEISQWNARSEAALAAGRALTLLTMAQTPERAIAFLPFAAPQALKPLLLPVAKKALAAFIDKYHMREGADQHAAVLRRELDALEQALAGRRYVLGDSLTYADIAMAVVLQGVQPVDSRYMARLPGVPADAHDPELQRRYAALLKWRDDLYAQHRRS